jgi:hypothetical protein
MKNVSPAIRGWLSFAIGAVVSYLIGVGLVFLASGAWTYLHLVPVLFATFGGVTAYSWGASGFSPITKGFVWLDLGALAGFALGLIIDMLVQGALDWVAPTASLFALLIGFTSFFLGVAGFNAVSKGLIWQIIGTLTGAIFVSLIRVAMGLEWSGPFLFTEPAWVLGGFMGVLFFIGGNGSVSDWFKWARGIDTSEHHEEHYTGWEKYLHISLDHKVIGIQYTVTALFLISVGGLFALIFRTELAQSQLQFLTLDMKLFGQNGPQLYNSFMSLHGMIMIVSILLGMAGITNFVVPILLGAQDMAFPRLNAFAFWISVPASVLLLMSLILGGFDTGWTGYPPLSADGLSSPLSACACRDANVFSGCVHSGLVVHFGRTQCACYSCTYALKRHDCFPYADLCLGRRRNRHYCTYCNTIYRTCISIGDVPASLRHGIL